MDSDFKISQNIIKTSYVFSVRNLMIFAFKNISYFYGFVMLAHNIWQILTTTWVVTQNHYTTVFKYASYVLHLLQLRKSNKTQKWLNNSHPKRNFITFHCINSSLSFQLLVLRKRLMCLTFLSPLSKFSISPFMTWIIR